jgi:hypothetical protein
MQKIYQSINQYISNANTVTKYFIAIEIQIFQILLTSAEIASKPKL